MTFLQAIFFFCGLGTVFLLWISDGPEHRERRLLKLASSFPLLVALSAFFTILAAAPISPLGIGAIAMTLFVIWRDEMANLPGKRVLNILYGDGRGGGGHVPYYGFAQSLINEDKLKEAETEILEQLAKEPHNFEGNRMLAAIYQEWGQHDKAIHRLDQALLRQEIPASQSEFIEAAKEQLLELKRRA